MDENKYTILIADDSDENRACLVDILKDEYNIIEADGGQNAVQVLSERAKEIALVLLGVEMADMDGFDVLTRMNNEDWIKSVPVIMVSSDSTPYFMRRAYGLGAIDYIDSPYDSVIIRHRVYNTIMLYSKQKKLISLLVKQVYQRENNANLMANILGHIVEFRNGKSGSHVLNVGMITKKLLESLNKKSSKYDFTYDDILLISTAATLHDIGKISIPEEIAYKTGKLTPEEFEIMKSHSAAGAYILEEMTSFQNEPLMKAAKNICRWHHERYDGKGYPDGLVEDNIPIAAQVVGLADVYDVLISERVYKDAMSHERAVEMILAGECGKFNPELLECFVEEADNILLELKLNPLNRSVDAEIRRTLEQFFSPEDIEQMKELFDAYKQ